MAKSVDKADLFATVVEHYFRDHVSGGEELFAHTTRDDFWQVLDDWYRKTIADLAAQPWTLGLMRAVWRLPLTRWPSPSCSCRSASGTQVAVLTRQLDDTAATTATLSRELAGNTELEILPWQVALRELHEAIMLDDAGLYLMMFIIFVIVAMGIFNTVLMSVVERTREFGVMMAIGTGKGQLFGVVLTEALLLALLSAVVGLAIGLGVHALIAAHGIDITAMAGDYQIAGVVLEGRIYSRLTAGTVAQWTVVVLLLTLVSSLYPALRATRLQPVEAMRHV